jgi:hypothetical protein
MPPRAQILVEAGADVNAQANTGETPLHDAILISSAPIVRLLLDHGADPTLADTNGTTAASLCEDEEVNVPDDVRELVRAAVECRTARLCKKRSLRAEGHVKDARSIVVTLSGLRGDVRERLRGYAAQTGIRVEEEITPEVSEHRGMGQECW